MGLTFDNTACGGTAFDAAASDDTDFDDTTEWMPGVSLSGEEVDFYHEVLADHRDQAGSRVCSVCGVSRCGKWRDAYDHLAASALVVGPASWWNGIGR